MKSKGANLVYWMTTLLWIIYTNQLIEAAVHDSSNQRYPEKVKIGPDIIRREVEITKVPRLNIRSLFCSLSSSDIDRICRACIEIDQSISNKFTYNMLKDFTAGECELQTVQLTNSKQASNLAQVHVRKCPMDPELFISQGNKPGWVLWFVPDDSKSGQLKTTVHLGPFDVLLHSKQIISKYLRKPMKVPLI